MLKGLTQKTVFYIILSNIYILIPVYELATRITSLAYSTRQNKQIRTYLRGLLVLLIVQEALR